MKKSHLAIGLVAVLIVVLFSVDYWLRANKKFVGAEVNDTPAASGVTSTEKPKPESFDTLFAKAIAVSDARQRANQLLALEGDVHSKGGAESLEQRRKVLQEVIKSCPDDPASADASSRLLLLAIDEKDAPAMAAAVQSLLDAAGRMGIYEKGVTPQMLEGLVRHLKEQPELAARIQAAIDSPQDYGPEDVREAARFRVGMKLVGEPFPAADNIDQAVKFRRRNMTKRPLNEELTWQDEERGPWKVGPLSAHVSLAPGQEQTIEFHARFDRSKGDILPFPSLKSVISRDGEPDAVSFARLPMDTRGDRAGHVIRCVRVKKAPTIDGKLDDEAWGKCKPESCRYTWNGFTPAPFATQISICYDANGMYVAMRCDDNDMEHAPAVMKDRDSDVCRDDSVEMMFNPKPEQTDYFQVIVNTKNTQYDGICWDRSLNFNWKSATSVDEKGWSAEFFLPWSEFAIDDVPTPGTKFVANFYRNRYRDKFVLTQWSPTFIINNHMQEYYGTMLFE